MLKRYSRDIVSVPFKSHDSVRIRGLDVVELDIVTTCCCEVSLVGSNSQAIDLGFGMLDCP